MKNFQEMVANGQKLTKNKIGRVGLALAAIAPLLSGCQIILSETEKVIIPLMLASLCLASPIVLLVLGGFHYLNNMGKPPNKP